MRPSDDQLWVWLNLGNARAIYEEAQRARAEESRMLLVGEDTAREIEALEAALADVVAEAGPLGHDGYHEDPLHGATVAKALALLKPSGVKP